MSPDPSTPTVRVDFEPGDPHAPTPTSCVPGASVVVIDSSGRVLMIERRDSGKWALPGGAHDIGESLPQTAARECREETGVTIEIDGLVGTFTNPAHVFTYRGSRPEVRQEFSVLFTAHPTGGQPTPSPEAGRVAWVSPAHLDQLDTTTSTRRRLAAWRHHRRTGICHLG